MRRSWLCCGLFWVLGAVQAATPAEDCKADLEDMAVFMPINDAGAHDQLKRPARVAAMEAALNKAREKLAGIETEAQCASLLAGYLRNWRKNHLWISEVQRQADGAVREFTHGPDPQLSFLSSQTALLRLSAFAFAHRKPLQDLLAQQREALAQHTNWIIDVRGNSGGFSGSFSPLLPWLGDLPATEAWGWLVTPDNTRAQQQVCEQMLQRSCEDNRLVKLMQATPTGEYATITANAAKVELEPKRPERVVILSDEGCGSACEIFLLTARKSFNVKIVGRRSAGALDYADMRPHALPSAKRELFYAISKRMDAQAYPVDLAGVFPDIYLPKPQNQAEANAEIIKVQAWLEGGTLVR